MSNVTFSSGLPETVLPPDPLQDTFGGPTPMSFEEIAAAVAQHPRSLFGWAALGEATEEVMARYAFFRVGYHRGLDSLRAAGWRGSGYVRGDHPSNRGFLRCLDGLRAAAAEIGEADEVARCAQFLSQLDPGWSQP